MALLACTALAGQNRLSVQMEDGEPFRLLVNEKPVSGSAQSLVIMNDIKDDTLFVKVELGNGNRYGVTFYLQQKGKPTAHKEFNYILHKEKNRLKPVFMGMYEVRENQKRP